MGLRDREDGAVERAAAPLDDALLDPSHSLVLDGGEVLAGNLKLWAKDGVVVAEVYGVLHDGAVADVVAGGAEDVLEGHEEVESLPVKGGGGALVEGGRELGAEEWAAIRGAVEVLAAAPDGMKKINLESEREDMVGGAKEDLKAIWALAVSWLVEGDVAVDGGKIFIGSIFFCKEEDGERGGWEGVEGKRKGLEAVIDMTDEEFMREADIVHGTDEESGTEEEGEDPGIE